MEEKKETKKTVSAKEKALIAENEKLIQELEQAKAQAEENKDKWLRNVAEFDNYKKRNAKLWQDAFDEGSTNAILKILTIGDDLEWALTMGLDEKTKDGIINLIKKFSDTLTALGVTEINPVGEKFDPNLAEAVMRAPKLDGEESDQVKQVFQKGYKLKEKIIRYAKVSVTE